MSSHRVRVVHVLISFLQVHHRETGQIMVLKMNKSDVELESCTMLHEIKLMSHLSHPNIIR